jgi:hypothetical protein
VLHPVYNSDHAPSDFFLFETVKAELQNDEIQSREDLTLAMMAIFDEIPKEKLNSVYVSLLKRLKWVSKNEGSRSIND